MLANKISGSFQRNQRTSPQERGQSYNPEVQHTYKNYLQLFKVPKEDKIDILKVGIKSTWNFFRESKVAQKREQIYDPASAVDMKNDLKHVKMTSIGRGQICDY